MDVVVALGAVGVAAPYPFFQLTVNFERGASGVVR
jgi:hypothetical protein